jgi:hypothetical protein
MTTIISTPSWVSYGSDSSHGSLSKTQAAGTSSVPNIPMVKGNPVPFVRMRASPGTATGAMTEPRMAEARHASNALPVEPTKLQALQSRSEQLSASEREVSSHIPNYHAETSAYMRQFIKDHFGKDVDPDHVYLNEYDPAYKETPSLAGSIFPPHKTEVSAGHLIQSTPLSQVAYANLYAVISSDTKRFHITANKDPSQAWADQKDLIDPHAFYDSLHDLDFKAYYKRRIDQFYAKHGDEMGGIAQRRAMLDVDLQRASGPLSDEDYALAQRAFNPAPSDPNPPKVFPLEINGYQSNDGLVVTGQDRVLVYLRGENVPLRGFDSEHDFNGWLLALGNKPDDLRDFAAKHFSANDAGGRAGGPGVTGLLSPDSARGIVSLWHKAKNGFSGLFADSKDIHNDPFGNLVRINQRHDEEDANFDITSNADVNEKKFTRMMDYLPVPFASGLAGWFLGKTKSQQEDGAASGALDALSFGVGSKFRQLGYGIDYGLPIWMATHGEGSHPDPSQSGNPDDPDDPENPGNVTSNGQRYGANNWNKSW